MATHTGCKYCGWHRVVTADGECYWCYLGGLLAARPTPEKPAVQEVPNVE